MPRRCGLTCWDGAWAGVREAAASRARPQAAQGGANAPIDVDMGEDIVVEVEMDDDDGDSEAPNEIAEKRSTRSAGTKPASRRRPSVEPVRFAYFQAQEAEMSKLRYEQQLRKGEKRRLGTNGKSASGSSRNAKRSRAEERRSARQHARRRSMESEDADDWMTQPGMATDGSGPQSQHFTSPSHAVFATVQHSTTWRGIKLAEGGVPCNLLPLATMEPFSVALDQPLEAYSEELANKTVILPPSRIRSSMTPQGDVDATVQQLLTESQPLVTQCHTKRVNHILKTTRRNVRACLAELQTLRRKFPIRGAEKKHVQEVPLSKLESVAARKILQTVNFQSEEDKVDAMPTYHIGRGESSIRERTRLPKEIVILNRVTSISRSTTCIGVNGTLPVDDDPIIRYVPFFSQATKADTQYTQFPSLEVMQKAALSALDVESNEYVLRYIVHETKGDAQVFHALRDLAWCVQPQTDYTALQLRAAKAMLAQQGDRHDTEAKTLKLRLKSQQDGVLSLQRKATIPQELLAGYRKLFCRRCYVFNCQYHGVEQPVPASRSDPFHPVVKTSLRHLVERGDTDIDEDVGAEAVEVVHEDTAESVEITTDTRGQETEVVEEEEVEVRRSVRPVTAAATKASSLLVSQLKKPRRRLHSANLRVKSDPNADPSEYLGYDSIYRKITTARRASMLAPNDDVEPCSPHCHRVEDTSGSGTWTSEEMLLLDLAVRTVGTNACAVAHLLGFKSCAQVHNKILSNKEDSDSADLRELISRGHDHELFASVRGNTQEHLLRTRFQRMKDRGANHQYSPCNHTGSSCNANDCSCMRRDHFCERSCGCPSDCANRFPGCRCARGECGTAACPCYFSGRECDPDLCRSCGACEVPVLILDPTSREKNAKQLRICSNTNILRGAHRKVGVAESKVHGWGAYALEEINEGEFIYEYTGELLSQDEAERRGNVYDRNAVSFLFDLNEDAVVDAARKGNKSKFANHSSIDPNCIARIMLVNGDHRIGLYAKKTIVVGEELFFDYGHHGVVPDWSQSRIRGGSKTALPGAPTTPGQVAAASPSDLSGDRTDEDVSSDTIEIVDMEAPSEEDTAEENKDDVKME